jgi:hypothetical protein
MDMDDLMQIAVREMATAMGVSDAFVQLSTPSESIAPTRATLQQTNQPPTVQVEESQE